MLKWGCLALGKPIMTIVQTMTSWDSAWIVYLKLRRDSPKNGLVSTEDGKVP